MRSVEDKKLCYNHGPTSHENSISNNNGGLGFEFQHHNNNSSTTRGGGGGGTTNSHGHRSTALGRKLSAPSKWDDAQKWLVGLSSRDHHRSQPSSNNTKPRNSSADDLRLIAPVPPKDDDGGDDFEEEKREHCGSPVADVAVMTWRINKPSSVASAAAVRSVCVRDMGTEMTPIASQEPSRTATPVRATTPVARSPVSSGCSTPMRQQQSSCQIILSSANNINNNNNNNLETRAVAWDEAERAKYIARYKREEVKIQAWENHEKRKAEMEMKKIEVKAERIKARAEEKMANKLAATRRIAEEKRANAEAKLNEKAVRTSERADYIRRTGHLPSSFSFKLPSLNCW